MIGANTLDRLDYHRLNGFVVRRDKLPKQKNGDLQKFINHLSQNKPYNYSEDPKMLEIRRFKDFLERRNEFTDKQAATDLNKWISQLKNAGIKNPDQQKVFIDELIKNGENMNAVASLVAMMKTGELTKILNSDTAVIDYKKLSEELKNLLIAGFDSLRIDSDSSTDRRDANAVLRENMRLKRIIIDKYPFLDVSVFDKYYLNINDVKIAIDQVKKTEPNLEDFAWFPYPNTFNILASEIGEENSKDLINEMLENYLGIDPSTIDESDLPRILSILNNISLTDEQKRKQILKE